MIALATALVLAPTAQAADRYVDAVMGANDTSATCTAAPPADGCDLEHAIENVAMGDDNVFVAAGSYVEGDQIAVTDLDLDVIGAGSPATSLTLTADHALFVLASGVTVSGMRITHSTGANGALTLGSGGTETDIVIDRVSVSTSSATAPCRVLAGEAIIRNSVCRNTAAGGGAAVFFDSIAAAPNLSLRNVTAYATGPSANGLYAYAQMSDDVTVDARNSIFRATDAPVDVIADNDASAGVSTTVALDFSSFADALTMGMNSSVTPPGSLSNLMALPLFNDTDTNFQQAAGSPTIDRGSAAFASGLDLDGQARIQGSAPDMGADEFVPAAATPTQPAAIPAATAPRKKCKKGRKLKKGKCVKKKRKRRR